MGARKLQPAPAPVVRQVNRKLAPLMSSTAQDWGTPADFFAWLHSDFRFSVDVCANRRNAKLPRFYTSKDNGLAQSWRDEVAWMNPPYSHVADWMRKARHEAIRGATVVCLVPARVDAAWWQDHVMGQHGDGLRVSRYDPVSRVLWLQWRAGNGKGPLTVGVYFHDQRLQFTRAGFDPKGAASPFPPAVVIFHGQDPGGRRLKGCGVGGWQLGKRVRAPLTYRLPR